MEYSVVMATRPREPFIQEAINSVLLQTAPPKRLHVVVNGPDAGQSDVTATYRESPVVSVHVRHEPGQPGALKAGLVHVDTPYVAFLDADDLWAPEKQERQIAQLEAETDLDAVSCEAVNFQTRPDGSIEQGTRATTRMFAAVTFRRDAFDRYGQLDPAVDQFQWLVRWWAEAQTAGIRTGSIDYRGLWRRVHDANGWVTQREVGRAQLLSELRRIHGASALGVSARQSTGTA